MTGQYGHENAQAISKRFRRRRQAQSRQCTKQAQASATQRRQAQVSSGNAQNPVKPGLQTQKKPRRAFAKA